MSTTITLAVKNDKNSLTVQVAVVAVVRKQEPGVLAIRLGLHAQLDITVPGGTDPHRYFVSRLVGERFWLQDAHLWPHGYPHFSHGFGSRCAKKYGIPAEVAALLDQEALRLGLVAALGPHVPLALAEPSAGPATAPVAESPGEGQGPA